MARLTAVPLLIVLTLTILSGQHPKRGGETMTSTLAAEAYENLTIEFAEEEGVTITDDGLAVHGTVFAYLDGDDLVVDLPAARTSDLVSRGIGSRFKADGVRSRDLVRVTDRSFWSELTREAHEYVGEPPVGGQS
jgi:hypothetical protein